MPTADCFAAAARELMKMDAVIVTAAEWKNGEIDRLQVYFWDEHRAVMDIISKADLLENWPDAGAHALDINAKEIEDAFPELYRYEGAKAIHIRFSEEEAEADELPPLPGVLYIEAVEAICALEDKIKL